MNDYSTPEGGPPSGDIWTFESAADFWKTWETRCDDAVWNRFSEAEEYLLHSWPRDAAEAAVLVEVLIANAESPLETGPLRRLHSFLTGSVDHEPGGLDLASGPLAGRREDPVCTAAELPAP